MNLLFKKTFKILTVCFVTSSLVSIGILLNNNINSSSAKEEENAIYFSPTKNLIVKYNDPESGIVDNLLTEKNNPVTFSYYNTKLSFYNENKAWAEIKYNGGYVQNETSLSGLSSIELNIYSYSKQSFKLYWSRSQEFVEERAEEFIANSDNAFTFDFYGYKPNYIRICGGNAVTPYGIIIKDLCLKYDCFKTEGKLTTAVSDENAGTITVSPSVPKSGEYVTLTANVNEGYEFGGWYRDSSFLESEDLSYKFIMKSDDIKYTACFYEDGWKKEHGIIPVFDGNTVTYGLYPQTYVATSGDETSELAVRLDQLEESKYNNFIYDKVTREHYCRQYVESVPRGSGISGPKFRDGTTIEKNKTYYFKCEKITWDIVKTNDDSTMRLVPKKVLDRFVYNKYGNGHDYNYSNLKQFVKDTFIKKAFSLSDKHLLEIEENTKAIIGTSGNYSEYYPSDELRKKESTDYFFAVSTSNDNVFEYAGYWTTDFSGYDQRTGEYAYMITVNNNGGYGQSCTRDNYGIAPIILFK